MALRTMAEVNETLIFTQASDNLWFKVCFNLLSYFIQRDSTLMGSFFCTKNEKKLF